MPTTFEKSAPTTSTQTERREGSLSERIWQSAGLIVRQRLEGAQQALEHRGYEATPNSLPAVAGARQAQLLEQADVDEWTTSQATAHLVALTLLEMPNAARVYHELNDRPDLPAHEKAQHVATMAQFNHHFANALAYMPPNMVAAFPDRLHVLGQRLGEGLGASAFTQREFGAIARGVEGEVAFLRAMRSTMPEGWSVRPSLVKEDVLGIDVVVTDDAGRQWLADLKAAGSYRHQIDNLVARQRISQEEGSEALELGYVGITDTFGQRRGLTIYTVDADALGEINQFEYLDQTAVFDFVEARMAEAAQRPLRALGSHAIK